MNIDTGSIRRLRDSLLRGESPPDTERATPEVVRAILRRVEPFAETMYLVMMVDGEPADTEKRMLVSALGLLTGGLVPAQELMAMLDRAATLVERDGVQARVAALGARLNADRDDRETAFTLAAAVAIADERIDVREHGVVALIREYFGVSEKRAAVLLEAAGG